MFEGYPLNEFEPDTQPEATEHLTHLRPCQVEMIDEAIGRVGEFGEVRLVIEKGRLRYVCIQQSHDVLKWVPGQLDK